MSAPENQYAAALSEAIKALRQVRAERDALLAGAAEPIAIVGIGCRLPGGIDGPEAFWQALERGVDAVREIPPDRWPSDEILSNRPAARWAGLIDRVDTFDAAFFGISPREAESLDPQQRLLLEVAWEALENAGQRPDRLEGRAAGVFLGLYSLDYQHRILLRGASDFDAYCATGNLLSTAAGRVSYSLGFQGPCLSVDTACSSSLVALSLACQSLRSGTSEIALAGGVNLILSSLAMNLAVETQALSPDGRCKTFDSRANGYVRSEGCGIVVLKRLSDAQRDGDPIRALIRGWAVNQDGRSTGLTTPNVLSQQALLKQALASARVPPEAIGYVELHGTGTPLGDPIEADALREVFGKPRTDGSTCVLGAVKSNVGHLEAAAGVTGLIKAVLSLEHEQIPRNLHFRRLNPRISLDGTPFVLPTETTAWKRGAKRRIAGVSGFGISGTNAHVILEEAPSAAAEQRPGEASSHVLPLSAKTPQALTALALSYAEHLSSSGEDLRIADLAYTASVRRMHHEHRFAVAGRTREELVAELAAFAGAEAPVRAAPRGSAGQERAQVAFVFSGQGSQWVGMGQRLLAEEKVFRTKLEECDALLRKHVAWSLLDELGAPEERSRLGETEVVQPALFAVQVGLAALLQAWGVTPDAVIGHSVGEVAAAHVAGALSLEEAVRLVAWRGRIMQKATGLGKMAWVALPPADAEKAIAGREAVLAIAAVNDPASVVLSGEAAALDEVVATLSGRGVECRALKVNYAFHSPQMDTLARELVEALGRIEATRTTLPLYSTVTGAKIDGEALDAAYWGKNVRERVQLARAVSSAFGDGQRLYLEVGPHPVLATNLTQCLGAQKEQGHVAFTLRRQGDEPVAMRRALGNLHTHGFEVDWKRLFPAGGQSIALPTYPWQRERYWIDPVTPTAAARASRRGHPLLGEVFRPADRREAHYWEQWMSVATLPYLTDHQVQGEVVFPGAGYVEMALAAAAEVLGEGGVVLDNLSFEWILSLPAGSAKRVQIALRDEQGEPASIDISSRDEDSGQWVRHARVTVSDFAEDMKEPDEAPQLVQERCPTEVEGAVHYARMEARHIQYGPAFRGVERIWVGPGEALGRVRLPEQAGDASAYRMHPALLDACFQIATVLVGTDEPEDTFVPVAIDRLRLRERIHGDVWVKVSLSAAGPGADGNPVMDLAVMNEEGLALLEIAGLRVQRLGRPAAQDPFADCAYTVLWRQKELPAESAPARLVAKGGIWLVFVDERGTGADVAARLRARGDACVEVEAGPGFEQIGPTRCTIDPSRPEDYQRLLREAVGGGLVCRGVVHLWSLDAAPWERTTGETLLADLRRGSASVLRVVQALGAHGFRDAPRLVLVTRGSQAVGEYALPIAVSQAPLWGLGRTIAMEQPDLGCTRVDLAPDPLPNEAAWLERELLSSDGEDQVALREDGRHVARLERGYLAPTETPAFSAEASYVITGGLSGLGLTAARWLVEHGARHLLLVGRSEPSEATREAIRAMGEAGAEVRTRRTDVSQLAEVESMIEAVRATMPPLRGLVHAAGVLDDRTLSDMTEEQFSRPMGPKVLGAWNLHAATRGIPLDFFVMYSSAAALLGSPGQGNYAAANTFLDALAHARAAEGWPAMSIQWGPFSDVGLAAAGDRRGRRLESRGIESFTPEEGTALLSRLIQQPWGDVGLFRISIRQWVEFYPRAASAPFLAHLREEDALAGAKTITGRFQESLQNLPPAERRAALEQHVFECLARVLHLPVDRIDPHAPLRGYGMDSLMSLEIRNRLEASLGLRLSASLLYTYSTTATLVEHLLGEMVFETRPEPSPAHDHRNAEPTIQFFELSEQSAMAILDEKLLDLEDYLK
ncbi:MAG: type I polyketide synthase [Byssovorax sp.]